MLRQNGLGALREVVDVPAGSVNTNLRIITERNEWFLRLYEQVDAKTVAREHSLILHLKAQGIPTPAPLALRSGRTVAKISGKPVALFPVARGRELCHLQVTNEHARSVGELLANVHRAAISFQGLDEGRFSFSRMCASLKDIDAEHRVDLRQTVELLRHEADFLARTNLDLPSGVIHGDLFRDNVRFEEGRIVALLDFESASVGRFCYDLATCLLAWTYFEDFRADLARALLSGYASIRPLLPEELSLGLWVEARRAAFRFCVTRILDFALRPALARTHKDYRRYVARLQRLRELGSSGWSSVVS